MGEYKSGNTFYYRMNKGFYHMPVSVTNFCIYHETYSGPFNKKKDVHFPKWAPEQKKFIGIKSLISKGSYDSTYRHRDGSHFSHQY